MTKEEIKKFEDHRVRFIFEDTEEVRDQDIEVLLLKDGYEKALHRNEIFKIGDLINKWDKLNRLNGIGEIKVRHIRAALFAYLMEIGAIKETKLVEV